MKAEGIPWEDITGNNAIFRHRMHYDSLAFNSLPHFLLTFVNPKERKPLKILWEKEKMLVTSIFSFSHNAI